MLSAGNAKRMRSICSAIATGSGVSLDQMIWATKLASKNSSAADMLKRARLTAIEPDMPTGGISEFLRDLGIGETDPITGLDRNSDVDDIINFFRSDRPDDWRQRD